MKLAIMQLRVARPVADIARSVDMYCAGLGLSVLGRFEDHGGFDGAMLGARGADHHFEFTRYSAHAVAPSPTAEDLWVFYVSDDSAWQERCASMLSAGFREVASFNPYWSRNGRTFADLDGYRVVVQHAAWEARGEQSPSTPPSEYAGTSTGSPRDPVP